MVCVHQPSPLAHKSDQRIGGVVSHPSIHLFIHPPPHPCTHISPPSLVGVCPRVGLRAVGGRNGFLSDEGGELVLAMPDDEDAADGLPPDSNAAVFPMSFDTSSRGSRAERRLWCALAGL